MCEMGSIRQPLGAIDIPEPTYLEPLGVSTNQLVNPCLVLVRMERGHLIQKESVEDQMR